MHSFKQGDEIQSEQVPYVWSNCWGIGSQQKVQWGNFRCRAFLVLSLTHWKRRARRCIWPQREAMKLCPLKKSPWKTEPTSSGFSNQYWFLMYTSSTAQGGGGSFNDRKPIGEVGCREWRMAERTHWWTDKWLERRPICLFICPSN